MIRDEIKKLIKEAIEQAQEDSRLPVFDIPEIKIAPPPVELRDPEDYSDSIDYSTNIGLVLSKVVSKKPMEIASILSDIILSNNKVSLIETRQDRGAGMKILSPGFINFILSWDAFCKELEKILEQKNDYGKVSLGQDKKVQIEFISANPTGPLTSGNGRGGFYGDVLANVLAKAGFDVEREYYINNVGEQIKKLYHSIKKDELAEYKGKYIDNPIFSKLLGTTGVDEISTVGRAAAEIIVETMIKPTVEQKMKIKFDNWFSEASLYEKGETDKAVELLKEKNLTYEQDSALWFRSTEFGDDKDRVLIKAGGEKTYLVSDVAYLKNKFERGFEKLIYVWGADHHGYIGRLKAAAAALGYNPENIKIVIMQLVQLVSGGKEVRMSKRTGAYVTIDELIDEVGLDVARFFFLMYSPDSHMNFDLDLAKERSEKNPVYYVQYAHARICSIFKKYKADEAELDVKNVNLYLLEHESELKLIKQLVRFPEIVEDIAKDYQVHRLPHYAIELVKTFHKFYEDCRVIDEKAPELTQARLALVGATQITLKNTLDLMGISAPEKM